MKSFVFAFCLFALLALNIQAQDYDRFSHAVFSYPTGKYNEINDELRKFLETELSNYKPINIVERPDIVQPKLEYVEAMSGQTGETAFPNYFPVSMLKEMLNQNGMKLDRSSSDL